MKIKVWENNEIKEVEYTEQPKSIDFQIYEKQQEISAKKQELANTDYKILKLYEAQILNETAPYNANTVIAERQEIRDSINELEEEINAMCEAKNDGTSE